MLTHAYTAGFQAACVKLAMNPKLLAKHTGAMKAIEGRKSKGQFANTGDQKKHNYLRHRTEATGQVNMRDSETKRPLPEHMRPGARADSLEALKMVQDPSYKPAA